MFTVHTAASAPAGSRDALAALERNVGFVPNLAATIAGSPAALTGFVALQTALRGTTRLTALEREVVALTVSRHNDCTYSLAAHSRFAAGAGGTDTLIAALRSGEPLGDERLERLRGFTAAVLATHGHTAPVLDAEETLEVLAQIAHTTLANHAADVSGAPIDEAFGALV